MIAERKAGAGDEAYRGLVPETFVGPAEEEAEVTAAPEAQQQQQVQQAASQDAVEADVSAEQDEWIRDARRLISQAGSAPRKAAVAGAHADVRRARCGRRGL